LHFAFSPDGALFASRRDVEGLSIRETRTGRLLSRRALGIVAERYSIESGGSSGDVLDFAFSPDHRCVAVPVLDYQGKAPEGATPTFISIFDAKDLTHTYFSRGGFIGYPRFARGCEIMAAATGSNSVLLWNIPERKELLRISTSRAWRASSVCRRSRPPTPPA
jgi:hypothetical protein